MQPDCIAQSSKLSVCVFVGCLCAPGEAPGQEEWRLHSPPPPPTSAGQGTPLLEIAAILGKEVARGPGRGEWRGVTARRGGLAAPQPLGATGGRAGAGRTGARRPRRLGEGCARVPWFLPGVVRGNAPAPASFSGSPWAGRWWGEVSMAEWAREGRDRPCRLEIWRWGKGGHLLSPVGADPDSATHLAPHPPHPLPSLCLPAERQVSERLGARGTTPPGTEPPLTWLEGVSQEEP